MSISAFHPPTLWHQRRSDDRAVGWLELFYDLVFVAALVELGSGLVSDVSWAGAARFAGLFALLWWAWVGTTFLNNRIAVDDVPHRLLTLVQMLGIGAAAVVSKEAFGASSAQFALAYGVIRLTLAAMYVRALRHAPASRPVALPYAAWFGLGATLWLVSAAVPAPWRFWLWGAALLADLLRIASPRVRDQVVHQLSPDREHMTERYALFTIIVLGESFLKTIGALADEGGDAGSLLLGAFGLAITAALWWTYFDDLADSPIRDDLGTAGPATWVYGHMPLTLGLTATGVAVEKLATLDLAETAPIDELLLITGAIALSLLSIAALDAVTRNRHFGVHERERVVPRLAAVAVLGLIALGGRGLPAWALGALVSATVVLQIAAEVVVARRADRRMTRQVAAQVRRAAGAEPCQHLVDMGMPRPRTRGCQECLEHGGVWVNLRVCADCGHVGCCDDSEDRHATAHFEQTGHPVIRSGEPDQHWAWCFADEQSAELAVG